LFSGKVKTFCPSIRAFLHQKKVGKTPIILGIKSMDFFIELSKSCAGMVLMFLVMADRLALKMWQKE
jgi:hypothetical protein